MAVNKSRKRSGFVIYLYFKGMQGSTKGVTFLSKMVQRKPLDLRAEPSRIKLC